MINFVTINGFASDVLLTIRGAQLSQSEPISKRLIESLMHQGRAILVKQRVDKNQPLESQFLQSLQGLELEEVKEEEGTTLDSGTKTFRTKLQIPKIILGNKGLLIGYVGTIDGEEFMYVSESRSRWQQYKKYTSQDRVCYMKNNYLYVTNDKELRYLTIKAAFEVPTEVSHLENPNEIVTDATGDSPYPMPISLLMPLKEIVLKQLGIMAIAPSDLDNDSASKLEDPIDRDRRYTRQPTR